METKIVVEEEKEDKFWFWKKFKMEAVYVGLFILYYILYYSFMV